MIDKTHRYQVTFLRLSEIIGKTLWIRTGRKSVGKRADADIPKERKENYIGFFFFLSTRMVIAASHFQATLIYL